MNQSGEQLSQNDPARASFSPWRTASHAQQRCGLPENSRAGRPGAPGRQPVACRSKGLRRRRHSGQLVNSFSFGPPKKTKRRRKWPLAGEVARPPLFWTMEPCAAVQSACDRRVFVRRRRKLRRALFARKRENRPTGPVVWCNIHLLVRKLLVPLQRASLLRKFFTAQIKENRGGFVKRSDQQENGNGALRAGKQAQGERKKRKTNVGRERKSEICA